MAEERCRLDDALTGFAPASPFGYEVTNLLKAGDLLGSPGKRSRLRERQLLGTAVCGTIEWRGSRNLPTNRPNFRLVLFSVSYGGSSPNRSEVD
jgi:hypothetical protein